MKANRHPNLNLLALLLVPLLIGGCAQATTTPTAAPLETAPTEAVPLVDDGAPLAPKVIGQRPSLGEEAVLDAAFEITFDQPMDQERTTAAWRVVDPSGDEVAGEVSWPNARTLHFQPEGTLLPGTSYHATLGVGAASAQGVLLDDALTFTFNTLSRLEVSQVFPAPETIEIETSTALTVVFNRPVVPLVAIGDQADLPQPLLLSPASPGAGEWLNTSVYVYRPDTPLTPGTTYTATVAAGLADATGEKGTELAREYTWSFTTTAPSVRSFELPEFVEGPSDYYEEVPLDANFKIAFWQPMDREGTEDAFSLVDADGGTVAGSFRWDTARTEVTFRPLQLLELGTGYTLTLSTEAQAAAGGTLDEALVWHFRTVPPPGILLVSPADGEVQRQFSGTLDIEFFAPMDPRTLKGKVVISPEPSPEAEWYYGSRVMSFYGLKPSTDYTVTILPGMADPFGNRIRERMTIHFTTAAYSPYVDLRMREGVSLFRAKGVQEAFLRSTNVEEVDFALYRLTPRQFVTLTSGETSPYDFRPQADDLVRAWTVEIEAQLNERRLDRVPLAEGPDGHLPPGLYFLALDSPGIRHPSRHLEARLVAVATANLTLKSTLTEALVWLTDLERGEPVGGAQVTVYDSDFRALESGLTDDDGLLRLDLPTPKERYEARFAFVEGEGVFAVARTNWGSDFYPYDLGIPVDYYTQPGEPTVYLYTDRPMYRPGQTVSFKGIARADDDLEYSLPDEEEVEVRISSYDETVYEETLPLSDFGTFDGELTLDEEAALGSYFIRVGFPGSDESIAGLSFSVAEYRKPEFQVEVQTSQTDVLDGESLEAVVQATYFSGGAVPNAEVRWGLRAEPYTFRPPGALSRYSYEDLERDARRYEYPGFYAPFDFGQQVAEGEGLTDEDGVLKLELPLDLGGEGGAQRLTLEVTVADIAGNQVSSRASVIGHRAEFYIGARPAGYIGVAGQEQTFELVVVDWDGRPVPGQSLSVEVVERRWRSVQEVDERGRTVWTTSVEEIPIVSFPGVTADEDGRASVTFTPPRGGVYAAKASTRDPHFNPVRSAAYMWVSGEDYVPWRRTNDRSFELVADRESYQPGDTAEILIASPFQGPVYALVTVERGHVRHEEVIRLTSNSTVYRLPVTADMSPNVYFSVVVVKGVDETSPLPDYKISMTEIQVDTLQRALNVELTPDREGAGPGEEVTYTLRATDHRGQPAQAEFSLALVDLAALSLSGPNSRPILEAFYDRGSLAVLTAVPLTLSAEAYNLEVEEAAKGGGGGGAELGVFEVREEFPDTALWRAHVVTDGDGQASVTVKLPDNLTTWRMDARGVTLKTLVGQTTADLVSSKPLLVRPQTPRFFVAGDRLWLGATLQNNTDADIRATAKLEAEGVTLAADPAQQVEVSAGGLAYARWLVTVDPEAERVDLVFSAAGGGLTDASRPPLATLEGGGIPVYRFEVQETVATAGALTAAGARTESISLPTFPGFDLEEGELTIELAPSLAAGMTDGLTYLKHFPYECTEQTVSRFLPNVLTTRALKEAGLSDPDLEENLKRQVNLALQRLYNQQHDDGGWGWWPRAEESDPLATAYVVQGMVEAQESGYAVDEEVIERAVTYLVDHLEHPGRLEASYRLNRQAFILYVLARAGEPQVSETVQLYEARPSLALYARGFLAQALAIVDPDDPRLEVLVSDFVSKAIASASGAHWEEEALDYWNWNTNARTTAIALDTLVALDPQNALNSQAVRWMMANRQAGHWGSTQETAWSLMALTRWMSASGELKADYRYEVALNGRKVGGGTVDAESIRETQELRLTVQDLLTGELNRLTVGRDSGPGNLYYTSHLSLSLPVERIEAADRGVIVSRRYYLPENPKRPIEEVAQGETLLVRLTIVAPHDLHYVLIEDPLPAGVEAVDRSLKTSEQISPREVAGFDELFRDGWGWWYFDHQELRDEKMVLSADYLPAGTYEYTYLVHATIPGEYQVMPPTAHEFYFPEVYGRGAGSLFEVNE